MNSKLVYALSWKESMDLEVNWSKTPSSESEWENDIELC